MAQTTNKLNDLQLRRLIAAKEPVAISDGGGLTFTLSKGGTAAWVLRYRYAGRRKELTIGNYPDISLSAARIEARAYRAKVDAGGDPATEKQEAKTRALAAWTMRDLVAHYREKSLTPDNFAKTTIYYREADIEQFVLPRFGSREVRSITSIDIVHALKESGRTWLMTKRALTSISQILDHACGLTILAANPCTGIKLDSLMGKRPPVKGRTMLSQEDLTKLLQGASDLIGRENALALMILLATCVRGAELVEARKEHINFDAQSWWVPDQNVKTRTGFLVPLAPRVMEWMQELITLSGDSAYLLPTRRADRVAKYGDVPVGRTTLWAAITRAFKRGDLDIKRFTPHDTRSTAKGHLRNMGISREISEIALNHKLKGMEAVYDVREEIPERRRALALWADFLQACEQGTQPPQPHSGKVVHLRRVA